jgi:hypothetical protein
MFARLPYRYPFLRPISLTCELGKDKHSSLFTRLSLTRSNFFLTLTLGSLMIKYRLAAKQQMAAQVQ